MVSSEITAVPNERIARLVKKLGGPACVARAIGSTPGAVQQWRITGQIPWRWRSDVRRIAESNGHQLNQQEMALLRQSVGERLIKAAKQARNWARQRP